MANPDFFTLTYLDAAVSTASEDIPLENFERDGGRFVSKEVAEKAARDLVKGGKTCGGVIVRQMAYEADGAYGEHVTVKEWTIDE